jgi:CubicO group peptidase (beta-lactamase class C family)
VNRAFGATTAAAGAEVTTETLFQIGSITQRWSAV